MPGGKIAVYTGLLEITKNKNGLYNVCNKWFSWTGFNNKLY